MTIYRRCAYNVCYINYWMIYLVDISTLIIELFLESKNFIIGDFVV